MSKIRFLSLLFCLLTFSILPAQTDKSNYALLWEISGNGLEKPSYLMGSFHVRNKIAFEFSDSLLYKLEACEAFANEIHLDSAMYQVFQAGFDESSSVYDYIKAKKEAKEKFDSGEIDIEEILEMERNRDKKRPKLFSGIKPLVGEGMPTYLDAYLMNIAKRQGKSIYGLEEIDKHFDVASSIFGSDIRDTATMKMRNFASQLIDAYQQGDIEKIDELEKIAFPEGAHRSKVLIDRNYIMANSMERIIEDESLFAVVGAAHLPGKEGLIDILQKRGYHLRKVTATFTGLAKKYRYDAQPLTWHTTESADKSFRFETKEPAQKIYLNDEMVNYYVSIDIGRGKVYSLLPSDFGFQAIADDVLFDTLEQQIFTEMNAIVKSEKAIEHRGWKGKEYVLKLIGEEIPFYRTRLIPRNGRIFILMAGAFEEKYLDAPSIDRFFESLEFLETKSEWETITNKAGAFRADLPNNYKFSTITDAESSGVEGNPYYIHLYAANDVENSKGYVIRYNNFPKGMVLDSDSIMFVSMQELLEELFLSKPKSKASKECQGYPAMDLAFENNGVHAYSRIVLRGNRLYLLLESGTNNTKNAAFFDSFHFENFEPADFKAQSLMDSSITLSMPAKATNSAFDYVYGETKKHYSYEETDINSGSVFVAEGQFFQPYYYVDNLDSLFLETQESYREKGDSLLYSKKVRVLQKYEGLEFAYQGGEANLLTRYLVFLTKDRMISLTAYLPRELLQDATINSFFEPVDVFIPKEDGINIFEPKTDLIFKDLMSLDSATFENASEALTYYSFKEKDWPQLLNALENDYSDDTLDYFNRTRDRLLDIVTEMENPLVIPFLKDYYLRNDNHFDLSKVLVNLNNLKTKGALDTYFELIEVKYPDSMDQLNYRMVSSFWDSLALFQQYYPKFLKMARQDKMGAQFYLLSNEVLEDSAMNNEFILEHLDFYYELTEKELETYFKELETDKEEAFFSYYVINFYKNIEANEVTVRQMNLLANKGIGWSKRNAIDYLLEKKQSIQKEWILPLLQDSIFYYRTIDMLSEHEQLALVPEELLDPKRIAKEMIIDRVSYYEEEESFEITLLQKLDTEYKGELVNMYAFKIKGGYYDHPFLGIAGPFSEKDGKLHFSDKLVNVNYNKFNIFKYKQEVKQLIKEAKEREKE